MVKASKKQTGTLRLFKKHMVLSILIVIALLGVLATGIGSIIYYANQQAELKNLSLIRKDLEDVYDNLLLSNRGNVASSYLRDDCSIGHTSWLEKRISCGPSGDITLSKAIVSLQDAANSIVQSTNGTTFKTKLSDIDISYASVALTIPADSRGISCYIGYSQNTQDNSWGYTLVCRKDVANSLPGYEIKQ